MKIRNIHFNKAELEIATIIKFIIIGVTLVIILYIISTIFTQDVAGGFERFFNLL
ncbi:MAG: hypothetical protein LAT82_03300 [Nanoarchaeota archaeon]|nr:hypothetical protein [Nanoarchaeota archaeon]